MAKTPTLIPVSDLRQNSARVLNDTKKSKKPLVITQRGRATAVLMSLDAYERSEAEREAPAHDGPWRERDCCRSSVLARRGAGRRRRSSLGRIIVEVLFTATARIQLDRCSLARRSSTG